MFLFRAIGVLSLISLALSQGPPSQYGTLAFTQRPNITTVTVQNPPTNLADAQLISDLHDFLIYLQETPDAAKVVIFKSSNPDFFISHIDLNLIKEPIDPAATAQYIDIAQFLQNITSTIFIAATNGHASGAGHEWAVQMDMRFAGPNASSGSPEDGFGIVPGIGGELFLGPLINKGRAMEYVLGAKSFDAATGTRLGLWNDDFPTKEALYQYVDELADRIALFPRGGLNQTKSILGSSLNPSPALLGQDENAILALLATDEVQNLIGNMIAIEKGNEGPQFELSLPDGIVDFVYQ